MNYFNILMILSLRVKFKVLILEIKRLFKLGISNQEILSNEELFFNEKDMYMVE